MTLATEQDSYRPMPIAAEHDPSGGSEIDIATSLMAAVAYADLFDYPLTLEELARFQVGTAYSAHQIAVMVDAMLSAEGKLSASGRFYSLRGREQIFSLRLRRERTSQMVWRRARLWARSITRTPFVRMVAVTGALSMNNLAGRPDIDLLIITEPGRVWVCRRLLIFQVRLARLLGDDLCPNYILSAGNLQLDQRDFFTAHELAQMVLLSGEQAYLSMLEQNAWARSYLPSAFTAFKSGGKRARLSMSRRALEKVLSVRPLDRWEAWELRRLRAKLSPIIGDAAEVVCSPEQCKGHTGLHRSSVLKRYRDRLAELGIYEPLAHLLDTGTL